MITWTPIAELPDDLKDGRQVLLWLGDDGATTANWIDYEGGYTPEGKFANWCDERGPLGFLTVTHFSEITPPGAFRMPPPAKVEVKGEFGWYLSPDYRAALEAVEPERNVRVKDGQKIVWQGTAGELLALATP